MNHLSYISKIELAQAYVRLPFTIECQQSFP